MKKRMPVVFALILLIVAAAGSAAGQKLKPRERDYVIISKPRFHRERKPNIELADAGGFVGEEHYTYLDFKLGGKTYGVFWRSVQPNAPVNLSESVTYTFRLRVTGEDAKVVEIRRGKKLVWRNPKLKLTGRKNSA